MNGTNRNTNIDIKEYELYIKDGVNVVYFLAILCVFGTIGNIHVIVIYQKQYKISNFKLFIIVLAINDLLTCILGMPFEILRTRFKFTFHGDTLCKISRFFVYIFSNTCGLILSFIAVERSRKICAPFRKQLSHKTVTITLTILFFMSGFLSVPTLVYCKVLDKQLPIHGNITGSHCACEKNLLYTIHQGSILAISTTALTIVLISYTLTARIIFKTKNLEVCAQEEISSITLIKMNSLQSTDGDNGDVKPKKVKKTNSKKSLLSRSSSKTRTQNLNRAIRNTVILMVATVISYVGILPVLIIGILQAVDSGVYEVVESHLGSAKSILTRLYFLSNVMHPFVYLIMDRTFRLACRDMYVNCIRSICRSRSHPITCN